MKRFLYTALFGAFFAFVAAGCADFVQGLDDPIDQTDSSNLDHESQVPFLITGIQQRFSLGYGQTIVLAEGLSDAFEFGGSNASFPTFQQAHQCAFVSNNNSSSNALLRVGQSAYLADELVERVGRITFEDQAARTSALYNAHLYAGLNRWVYATYYGLEPTRGGGFDETGTNSSPFVESSALFGIAINHFNSALEHANEAQARLVNSLIARTHLYNGNYPAALTAAAAGLNGTVQIGLRTGDFPLEARFSSESANNWFSDAGIGRSQFIPATRFAAYIEENPAEAERVRLVNPAQAGLSTYDGIIQNVYPDLNSPIVVIDWQESYLVAAEAMLRSGTGTVTIAGESYSALELVNAVRASHAIAPLEEVSLEVVYEERDKELFARGQRLADNRRFNDFDHCEGPWRYIVITERETNNNDAL